MKTLFFMSIFALVTPFVNGNSEKDIKNSTQAQIIQAEPVKPIEVLAPSAPQLVKTDDITDGVWEWKPLVEQYFPQSEVINALRIMSAENGSGDPTRLSKPNRNGTVDHGLFQINTVHKNRVDGDLSRLQDANTNVKIAYDIWSESGWKPWSTAHKLGL